MAKQILRLNEIIKNLEQNSEGIYSQEFSNNSQEKEIAMRTAIADIDYNDYLFEISRNHSIPVMDREVSLALNNVPKNSIILDLGGCWGWHWRNIKRQRPDVKVVIVDLVHQNFIHAKKLLGDLINDQIILVHGDATKLPFNKNTFDLVWTVQTFQHIPDFKLAVKESHRVLISNGGKFINYSLNRTSLIEYLYKILNKKYHIKGEMDSFYLERASEDQKELIKNIFGAKVCSRFTEILFKPELKFYHSGKMNSILGVIDSWLSGSFFILGWFARQQSFMVGKND